MDWEKAAGKNTKGTALNEGRSEGWAWDPVKTDSRGRSYGGKRIGQLMRERVYDCAFCKGTGERPKGSVCPVCRGEGVVSVEPPTVVCAFCKGRGEDKPRSIITCNTCKGKGVVSVKEPIEICQSCRGRGRPIGSGLSCIACRGKGVVTVPGKKSDTDSDSDGETEVRVGRPSGSEKEVLEIIYELGQTGRHGIAGRMHLSPAYAEYVCKGMMKKGLLTRVGKDMFALTEAAADIAEEMFKKEENDAEEVKEEAKIEKKGVSEKEEPAEEEVDYGNLKKYVI